MKREVQALLHRRNAQAVPFIFLGLVALVGIACLALVVNFFVSGPGQNILRTVTPSPTITFTPVPPTNTVPPSPTPQFTEVPTFTPGPSPTPAPITYTVQEGDTLFGISTQFQVTIVAIQLANNITGTTLSVGTVLIIPLGQDIQTPTPSPIPSGLPRAAKILYTVLLGDTLEAIAVKFNSTADDISNQNDNLTNANLQAGQVITVRVNLVTPVPTVTASATP